MQVQNRGDAAVERPSAAHPAGRALGGESVTIRCGCQSDEAKLCCWIDVKRPAAAAESALAGPLDAERVGLFGWMGWLAGRRGPVIAEAQSKERCPAGCAFLIDTFTLSTLFIHNSC